MSLLDTLLGQKMFIVSIAVAGLLLLVAMFIAVAPQVQQMAAKQRRAREQRQKVKQQHAKQRKTARSQPVEPAGKRARGQRKSRPPEPAEPARSRPSRTGQNEPAMAANVRLAHALANETLLPAAAPGELEPDGPSEPPPMRVLQALPQPKARPHVEAAPWPLAHAEAAPPAEEEQARPEQDGQPASAIQELIASVFEDEDAQARYEVLLRGLDSVDIHALVEMTEQVAAQLRQHAGVTSGQSADRSHAC